MKRTFKYNSYVSTWDTVDIGDVLILEGKDGSIFDTVIMKESASGGSKCDNCPLSTDGEPGKCMHYSFACHNDMVAVSINKIMENL